MFLCFFLWLYLDNTVPDIVTVQYLFIFATVLVSYCSRTHLLIL